MDAKEKPSQNQNIYNFTGKTLPLRRTASKGDLHGNNTNHLTLSIDLKNRIQENNDRINLTINSSRSFNQTARNFALPGLVNLANSDLRNRSDTQVYASSTPRDERSGMAQTKRSGFHTTSNQSKTRPNSPRTAKEELMTAKSQLNELRGIFANQTSTKFFSSTATTPSAATNRSKLDGDFQTLSQIEKRILARARFEKDRSESQSKMLKRRDVSYIADAISRPSTPGKLKMDSYRESSILANEAFGSPTSQMASIQGESPNPHKLKTRPILTSSLDRQQFSKLLKVRFEDANEPEGQYSLDTGSPIASLERRRVQPHTARNSEVNSSGLPSMSASSGFNENISKHFNTGLLDKISAVDYVMASSERTPRHQRASNMASPEDMLMIPKLSTFLFSTPQKTVKTEESDLLAKCKKECPNIFSGVLAGRQDVLLLSSWLKDTLNEVNRSNSSENEKLAKCDEVYNICLNDLIRQVSLECVERGDFLHQVWMSYYKLLLQFKTNVGADNVKAKIQHKKELEDQKADYLQIITQKDQEIERLLKESKNFQEENLKLATKNDKFLNKETKYKAKIDTLKDIISHMKTQMEELKAENRNYEKRFIKNPLLKDKAKKRLSRSSSIQVEYAGEDPKVKVIFASKDAETDSNAEKVPQINLIAESVTNLTVEDQTSKSAIAKTHNNIDDIDSDESIISETEFVFLDTETNTKQKYTFSQLNSHLLAYRPSRISTKGELNTLRLMDVDKDDAGVQTHISLMNANFDSLFNAQAILDELLVEKKLKSEVDNFAETTDKILKELEVEQKNLEQKILNKTSFGELKTQLGNLDIPDALLDSLRYLTEKALAQGATPEFFAKIGDEIASPEFARKSKFEAIDAILQIPNLSPSQQEIGQAQEEKRDTIVMRNTITTMPQIIPEEEEEVKGEFHLRPPKSLKAIESEKSEAASKNSIPNSNGSNSPLKREAEENEDLKLSKVVSFEKDLTIARVVSQEKDLRISRVASHEKDLRLSKVTSQEKDLRISRVASHEKDLRISRVESVGGSGDESKVVDEQQEQQEGFISVPQLVCRTEQTDQNQVTKMPEVVVSSLKTKMARRSLSIGKLNSMGNLDVDEEFMPEAIADKKAVGSVNFSERSEQNHSPDSPGKELESLSARMQRRSKRSSTSRMSVVSTNFNPRPSKVNFIVPFGEPRREQQQHPTFDVDANLSGKVKLILLARLYKTEKEKAESYRMDIDDLKEKLDYTKKEEEKSEKKVSELLAKMKKLEKKAEKCIHQVCPICGEQNNAADEEEEEAPAAEEEEENGDISKEEELDEENEAKEPVGSIELSNEEEEGENDEDPEVKGRRKYRRGGRKKTTKPTIGTIPELGAKKKQKEPRNPALAIIASIKNNGMRKFKNFMPMKGVLKHIYTLYNDRSKDNAIEKDEEFPKFVYTWFLNNFGFKKLAEQKFIIFVLSVKKYIYIVRINLFARFLGLLDGSSNYNLDELGKYLEAMDYISKVNMGSPIQNMDTDSKHYVAFLKGADYVKYFAETKMGFEEYTEFRKGIEAIKEADPRGINRNGIIDFDLLMTKMLAKYRLICNRTKQNVVNAFKAADLDGNKTCSMKEFILLYKNIEQEKYDYWFAETVFNEHADAKVDGEMNLTFDKFTVVCVEYTLFSDAQQDRFLQIQSADDIVNEMRQLKEQWEYNYTNVNENLNLLTKIPEEEVKYWRNIIDLIGSRVSAIDDCTSSEVKPLLIAYKILKVEIERLKEEDMEIDLYGVKKPKLERFDSSLNPLNNQFSAKDLFKQNIKNKAPNNKGRHSRKNEFAGDDIISQKKNSMIDKSK